MRPAPLSPAQERIWLAEQLRPGTPAFNIPSAFRISGPLDLPALEAAVADVVARHDVLRSRYRESDGFVVCHLLDHVELPLTVIDLTTITDLTTVATLVADIARQEAARPFDLAEPPLVRTAVVRLEPRQHVLLLTMHHIVSDEWSVRIFCAEVAERYDMRRSGLAPAVVPPPLQYHDYAAAERLRRAEEPGGPAGLADLVDRLERVPPLSLPGPRGPAAAGPTAAGTAIGRRVALTVGGEHLRALRKAGSDAGATLFMTLVAVTGLAVAGLCGQEELVIGSPVSGRNRTELETVIGCFVDTLLIHLDLRGDPTWDETLERARSAVLAARCREGILDGVVRGLRARGSLVGDTPLRVWFSYNRAVQPPAVPGLVFEDAGVDTPLVRHDVRIGVSETASGARFTFDFRPSAVDAAFVDHLASAVARLATDPPAGSAPLSTIAGLLRESASEKARPGPPERRRPDLARTRRRPFATDDAVQRTPPAGRSEPLLLEAKIAGLGLAEWCIANRLHLRADMTRHGAVLLRGFAVDLDAFEASLRTIAGPLVEYTLASTPRRVVRGRIYTSTEYPADQAIPLHSEMAYTNSWPLTIAFLCDQPAAGGGQTPLADTRRVLRAIEGPLRRCFEERGVLYERNFHPHLDLPWTEVFQTSDRGEVERRCAAAGIELTWAGSHLRMRQRCQAVATHPRTGEPVWFNQAHLFHPAALPAAVRSELEAAVGEALPRSAAFGDGSAIPDDAVATISAAFQADAAEVGWQAGDVLLVDNMLTAHGRRPYQGQRRLLAAMAEPHAEDWK
nr:condensation domain-containing protein [uncultured bacterium]